MEDIAVDMVVLEYDRYVLVMLYGELDIYTGRDLREQLTCLAGGTDRPVITGLTLALPVCTTLREAQWCVLPLSDTEIEAALGQGPC